MRALFIVGLALQFIIAGCSQITENSTSPNTSRIIYGLTLQQLSGLDPHINSSSELGIPLRQVYDTLVYRDPVSKEFVAGLATNWMISDDGLIYTFTLRQGVSFHDATPFNAQAVAANLDRVTNLDNASQKAIFMLGSYNRYEIVDDYTIRLILDEPYSPLLDSLSQVYLGIGSPTAFNQYSTNRYQFHQVGTGPFIFVEYIPADRIVLKRNPDYWGGPAFYQPIADTSITEIEFHFFSDPPTRLLALNSGDAQIMGEIQPLDARTLTGNSAVRLIPVNISGQPLQFLMNTKRFPTDNKSIRQALIYATNRNAIVDVVYQRFSPVAWGPISASTLYYARDLNGMYSYDTSQAQRLLESAGFIDNNRDGYVDIGGIDLTIDMVVPPWGLIPEVAQLLQDQWRTIGIKVNLQPVPTFNALAELVRTGEYHLVAFYTFGLDPSFLNPYFTSDGSNNWTGYESIELDNILNEAIRVSEPERRRELYFQAQHIIMDEALILPIRDYVNLNATGTTVQNLSFDAYGWFPILTNVALAPTS